MENVNYKLKNVRRRPKVEVMLMAKIMIMVMIRKWLSVMRYRSIESTTEQ